MRKTSEKQFTRGDIIEQGDYMFVVTKHIFPDVYEIANIHWNKSFSDTSEKIAIDV